MKKAEKVFVTIYTKETKYSFNEEEWYNSKSNDLIYHREDGPAIKFYNGFKAWWVNGNRHREDGPAVERPDGSKEWFINGEKIYEEDFNELIEEVDSLDPVLGLIDPREWVRERFKRKLKT